MTVKPDTKIVVIPENNSRKLSGEEIGLRKKMCAAIEKLVGNETVAVLASSDPNGLNYAKTIATHFEVELATCDCLDGENVEDGCSCIEDYVDQKFGLVIAIADHGVVGPLAEALLSSVVGRLSTKIHVSGMPDVHVIQT